MNIVIETPPAYKPLLYPGRYKGAHGGRGSGKSHFFAELLVEKALLNPGLRWVCIREVQKSLEQSVKRLVEDKIQKMGDNVSSMFEVMKTEIRTPGGGLILFQGMQNHTADSIKSLEAYDGAWVEEAQSLSQRSLDLLRPTIRKDDSELWFSWNPALPTDPIDQLLRSGELPPGAIVVQANWQDNPWFNEVLRQEKDYDLRRDPDKYAHVWGGGYIKNSAARVFQNWRVEEFETPDDAEFKQGIDFGYANDPTVLIRCFTKGRTLFIDREAYRLGLEIDHTPGFFDKLDPDKPEVARRWPTRADSARPETISYLNRHGYTRVRKADKGAGSVEDGIEFLKSYDIVVHPRCTHTVDELLHYSWKVDSKTEEILPILADKHNHVIDALRYACEALRKATFNLENV